MLKLKRMPHHTTIVKFAKRVSPSLLDKLILKKEAEIITIDSPGFDTNKQSVLSYKIRLGPRNDTIDFKPVLKNLSAKFVVADKGYDSRAKSYFVLRKMKAYPHLQDRWNWLMPISLLPNSLYYHDLEDNQLNSTLHL